MECIKCGANTDISIRHIGNVCKSCFLEIIEKRVRKDMRAQKLVRKNDRILLANDRSKEYYVGKFLLERIIKGLPVRIGYADAKKAAKQCKKYTKVIVPWSLDDEAEEFLEKVFNKNNKKKDASYGTKSVRLLKCLSEEEIGLFAEIMGFKIKKNEKDKRPKIKQMLGMLESRYPGYKFSLLNSIRAVYSLK